MLELYHEQGLPLVYYRGEYFLLGEDVPEGMVVEDVVIEGENTPSVRNVIATGNYLPYDGYLPDWTVGADFTYGFSHSEEGYLPDSRRRVYKVVEGVSAEFIVAKDGKDYCIRNGCSACEYNGKCGVKLEKIVSEDRSYNFLVFDVSAQEPAILAIISREPAYLRVMRNRELRKAGLLKYLDEFYKEYFGRDPNDYRESVGYWEWVDKRFTQGDIADLVRFNLLVGMLRTGEEVVEELEVLLEDFVQDFKGKQ
jgi:hypothetical protein